MLSQYIKNAEPSTELYDLFMDYYKLTDYGFKNLNEADIRKVLSGKSEEQKKKTAEKLRKFPDTVTVYRGEGSKSTPYTQSFSWTVSYKAACFFACRLPSAEDSTIVSAEVSKDDIIEFFPERNEAEVVILPSAVKSVKVDTLYGLESVEEEILEIMPCTRPAAKRFGICMQFMANSMQMGLGTMPCTRCVCCSTRFFSLRWMALCSPKRKRRC